VTYLRIGLEVATVRFSAREVADELGNRNQGACNDRETISSSGRCGERRVAHIQQNMSEKR
jgi:hypothetical protein